MTPVLPEVSGQNEDTTDLWNVLFRRQQLQNRLQFLKEIQKKNKTEESVSSDEGPSELERIEEELKLLEKKEKELVQKKSNQIRSANVITQSAELSVTDGKGQIQGLYVLPFSPTETISAYILVQGETVVTEQPKDVTSPEPTVEPVGQQPKSSSPSPSPPDPKPVPEPPEKILDVKDLTMSPAKVKCPSCQNVVTTEIRYKVGSNAFLFCCLLSVVGCLAGCCLVPFCVNRFKDVTHKCPSCRKNICGVDRI